MPEPEIPDSFLEGYARILGDVAVTGRRLTREELEIRRSLGRQAAEAGHQLRALVRMHLAATRTGWPGGAPGATAATVAAVTECVLAAAEQAVDAFAEGFERAQRLTVRREEAARREFIDDLLYGRSDLGRLAERATRFGLRLSRAHAVAVAAGPEAYTETDAVPRQVESALLARFGGRKILITTKDGRLICIAPGSQPDVLRYFAKQAHAATDGGRVAVGRAHRGPGGVVQSYDEALDALDLADRMGLDDPVLYSADLLVYPVLTRDRQAMSDLVRSELGPLQEARGGAEPLLKTLSVYFESGCVAAETARRLALSVRALTYRLERIHQLTGSDPSDPMHRYTLQTAVIGARLLDWPASEV
ncbi:helix-turn-helix domain-containing protein [Streptomyces sp. NPDC049967]|uniref:PucR family transcriptional regulator n=1 Tax=unclassified Streptomyces TaxID=2593676 RepID=UPI002E15122E|nr:MULTISPECIES: helix-turn-helix domain-containing protein [unclassified Streptomyces]WSJ23701.1 helix-turn-helix domain-containing protein [Streptomyces sp. NBC_01324]